MMLLKCCTQYVSKFGKLSSGHRTGKGQFSYQSQRKAMLKHVQTIIQLHSFHMLKTSLVAQTVKRLSTMRETWVRALHWEDPLEKEMTVHSSTIASKIPWTEEPGRLQSMGSQRVGHNWATSLSLSHANKVIHRILQARLQQCRTENFQMYKLGFEETE